MAIGPIANLTHLRVATGELEGGVDAYVYVHIRVNCKDRLDGSGNAIAQFLYMHMLGSAHMFLSSSSLHRADDNLPPAAAESTINYNY
jgi:hypothetical protein